MHIQRDRYQIVIQDRPNDRKSLQLAETSDIVVCFYYLTNKLHFRVIGGRRRHRG